MPWSIYIDNGDWCFCLSIRFFMPLYENFACANATSHCFGLVPVILRNTFPKVRLKPLSDRLRVAYTIVIENSANTSTTTSISRRDFVSRSKVMVLDMSCIRTISQKESEVIFDALFVSFCMLQNKLSLTNDQLPIGWYSNLVEYVDGLGQSPW